MPGWSYVTPSLTYYLNRAGKEKASSKIHKICTALTVCTKPSNKHALVSGSPVSTPYAKSLSENLHSARS